MARAMRSALVLLVVEFLGWGCSAEQAPCDPAAEVCELALDFGEHVVAAGTDDQGLCISVVLDNPTELWVSRTLFQNQSLFHHSNIFFVPSHAFDDQPDRVAWRCSDQGFDELTAAILGGVLYAQSTAAREETQAFAPGAAVHVPAWSRMVAQVHLLNASVSQQTTRMSLELTTLPPDDVSMKLAPFRFGYYDLSIPPHSRASFSTTCDLATAHESRLERPLDMGVAWLLPHYHTLGERFTVEIAGGPRDGQAIFDLEGYSGEAEGRAYDPPVDLAGATGLRFTCGFDNPGDRTIGWGSAEIGSSNEEMCMMLGFVASDLAFDASVASGSGQIVEESEDGQVSSEGPCEVIGAPWGER